MGKQAAQYEPEDPHYVMSTDSRGKKKRMVVSLFTRRGDSLLALVHTALEDCENC